MHLGECACYIHNLATHVVCTDNMHNLCCQVLDRCSIVTFAAYLPHNEEVWLFLEVPQGFPASEESGTTCVPVHLTT